MPSKPSPVSSIRRVCVSLGGRFSADGSATPKKLTLAIAVWPHADTLLFARRADTGLFGGLWELPAAEVDGVWVFSPLRHEGREWGTAVLSRVDGERRRIYTARYLLQIKGKERGKFEASVEEVGSGPVEQLPVLLDDVHKRTDDEVPPVEVDVASWFSAAADAPVR